MAVVDVWVCGWCVVCASRAVLTTDSIEVLNFATLNIIFEGGLTHSLGPLFELGTLQLNATGGSPTLITTDVRTQFLETYGMFGSVCCAVLS